jgi:prepilin peptidase CpaA
MLHTLSLGLLPALMIVAAMSDAMTLRIPNWLTGTIALLFLPMAWATGMPLAEFGWHLAAGVLLFVIGFVMFSFGLFGGGDAKLIAAAGLWFGTAQLVPFLTITAFAGGLLALIMFGWSIFKSMAELQGEESFGKLGRVLLKSKPKLPYGLAICLGAILAFPDTWWMVAA